MPKNKRFLILILCCFSFFFAHSQEKRKLLPLKVILEKISVLHEITFNYLEEDIVIYSLVEPTSNWSLDDKIRYIQKETNLSISITNTKYYNIFKNKKQDIPLCGFVLNAETNEPLGNANISLFNTNITTVSKENGYFEIPNITNTKIVVSYVGFEKTETITSSLNALDCPKIYLKPITTQLTEVIAPTYLTSGISVKNNGTIVIKPKKIGLLPGLTEPDVFRTMQQMPGITSVDESISNINVRGGSHDQNLILWNGIRLFQTGHFFGLISALNPNLAHSIKISKNGSSAIYGESTSSVIDISTHTNEIENSTGAVGLNMINGDFYTKLKTGNKSNLEISGRRSYTDFLNSPTYDKYSNRIFQNTEITNTLNNNNINYKSDENFYFYDGSLQFHQKIKEKTDLFIDGLVISNFLELNQSKEENSSVINRNSYLKQNTYGGNISLKTEWNAKNNIEFSAYGSYYKVDSENESIENNQIFNQSNDIFDAGIRILNNYRISGPLNLNTGYLFNEIGIRNVDKINSPLFSRKIKDVLLNHIAILELGYNSTNQKIKSTIGVRANYYDALETIIIEPRLQILYSITPAFSTQFLAESKNQTTSQIIDLQQDFLGLEKRRWIIANGKDVPITKSNQVSLGFNYKKNNLLITLDNYYKNVNGITTRSQGFQNQLEGQNFTGSFAVYGTELLIQKQIENFTTWVSYSYSKNNYTFSDIIPSEFPNNFEIAHNIGFAAIYDNQRLKLALGTRWHTGKPTTVPDPNNPTTTIVDTQIINYKSPNSSNIKDYFQLNFSSSYSFEISKKSKIQMGVSLENVLDTKNTINQFFRVNQNTKTVEKVNTFSLERTPNAFLRYIF